MGTALSTWEESGTHRARVEVCRKTSVLGGDFLRGIWMDGLEVGEK